MSSFRFEAGFLTAGQGNSQPHRLPVLTPLASKETTTTTTMTTTSTSTTMTDEEGAITAVLATPAAPTRGPASKILPTAPSNNIVDHSKTLPLNHVTTTATPVNKKNQSHHEDRRSGALFAERFGHTLHFENICLQTKTKKNATAKHPPKTILQNLSGHVPPRQITAIMGPSGAGKTSLLKILTGRASRSKLDLTGSVYLDGRQVDPASIAVRRTIAYVEQEVSIPTTSTPREAILFSAKLRLDRRTTKQQLETVTNEILTELGLLGCADTLVGGGLLMKGGLSGGEKKRCQCGIELVTSPGIIILDEPTSGLDSFSAEQLVDVLQRIANVGASVMITIHQPPPTVVRKIDHLILLMNGRLMYDGSMGIPLEDYFVDKGYPKPDDYNVADWILNVAQSVSESDLLRAGFFDDDACVDNNDAALYASTREKEAHHDKREKEVILKVGWPTEIALLFDREMKHLTRDKMSLVIRLGSTSFFGLFYGLIYLNIGKSDLNDALNIQAIFGAIANLLISTMFGVAQSALMDLPRDRPVFLREYSTNHYSVLPYFLSRFAVECVVTFLQVLMQLLAAYFLMALNLRFIVFLAINFIVAIASTSIGVLIGSAVEDPAVAAELMPLMIVPQLLFSGFFISTDLIPQFLRWAQYLCSLTYAVRLSLFYEFGDCTTDACVSVLERNGVYELDLIWYWLILVAIAAVFRLTGMIILKGKANFN